MSPVPPSWRPARTVAFVIAVVLATVAADARANDASLGLVRSLFASFEPARKTSGFAVRRHPVRNNMHFHQGVDLAAPHGTPVRSVADGRVAFASWQKGYGRVVYIELDDGARTMVYAHLSRIAVKPGERVHAGDTIGAVGNSGVATGPHLHFEVREGGKPVDPLEWADAALREPIHAVAHAGTHVLQAPADTAQCVALLQKFSLEALAPDELDFLRRGCAE